VALEILIIYLLWFIGLKYLALTMEADYDIVLIHAIIMENFAVVISMLRVQISRCFKTVDP
jgi:hypothetical protein